ncbi:hypothetical protein QR680_019261 [Steinernema hermaphroditum]|nr:hypothetical protein QR680_019261 [Steinernema hermaphroditum]
MAATCVSSMSDGPKGSPQGERRTVRSINAVLNICHIAGQMLNPLSCACGPREGLKLAIPTGSALSPVNQFLSLRECCPRITGDVVVAAMEKIYSIDRATGGRPSAIRAARQEEAA